MYYFSRNTSCTKKIVIVTGRYTLTLARAQFFLYNADVQGEGVDTTPPSVSKLRVVELSGKGQRIALDEYSQLVVEF